MSWDDARNHDDVLLPLDLAELKRCRPTNRAGAAERASWLFWKASLFDRLVEQDPNLFESAEGVAKAARTAGLKLLDDVASELVKSPLPEEDEPEQTWADALEDGAAEASRSGVLGVRFPVGFTAGGPRLPRPADVWTSPASDRPAASAAEWRVGAAGQASASATQVGGSAGLSEGADGRATPPAPRTNVLGAE